MLSVFRKLRKEVLQKGSFRKFLGYSLGEITLVVIGILLAVQINQCYQGKVDRAQEAAILKSLKLEQLDNANQLDEKLRGCRERIRNDSLILQMITEKTMIVDEEELARMLSINAYPITFDPAFGTIVDILNSGKINLIRNEALRVAISEWESELSEVKEAENYLIELSIRQFQEYLTEKLVLRNAYQDDIGASQHVQDLAFMQELAFENMLVNSLFNLSLLESRYLLIQEEITSMCALIDQELKEDGTLD